MLPPVLAALKAGKVLTYALDIADKDVAHVTWSIYGLVDTNEIAVVVSLSKVPYAAARAPSAVLVPTMADRRFGIDMDDQAVADRLSNELWAMCSSELQRAANNKSSE
ncbi:MAG: hypothetical protein ACRETN_00780 [Nevskiales bacterium]